MNPLSALAMIDRIKELGSKATIITAAASQLGRMLIKLCHQENIIPICTVRREEQAEFLRNDLRVKHVVNTSDEDWKSQMGAIALEAKPSTCLECISGDMTGEMMNFLGFGGTLILYGVLSDKPASGISVINLIGKNVKLEGFLLSHPLAKMPLADYLQFLKRAEPLYQGDLSTVVQKRFGLHEVKEAVEFYKANQTAGKVLLQPSLTPAAE